MTTAPKTNTGHIGGRRPLSPLFHTCPHSHYLTGGTIELDNHTAWRECNIFPVNCTRVRAVNRELIMVTQIEGRANAYYTVEHVCRALLTSSLASFRYQHQISFASAFTIQIALLCEDRGVRCKITFWAATFCKQWNRYLNVGKKQQTKKTKKTKATSYTRSSPLPLTLTIRQLSGGMNKKSCSHFPIWGPLHSDHSVCGTMSSWLARAKPKQTRISFDTQLKTALLS